MKKKGNTIFLYNVIFSQILRLCFWKFLMFSFKYRHSHKKRKDSLEGSLDGVLFLAELEFSKILVPRLPQHTSNVNTECARKSEQLYYFYVNSFLEHWNTLIYLFWY